MEKFQAAMVLGGVGDALGYRKGRWEVCISGKQIQQELAALGGLGALTLDAENWPLSDGVLMHMTTAEALITGETKHEGLKDTKDINAFIHQGCMTLIKGVYIFTKDLYSNKCCSFELYINQRIS